MKEGLDKLFTLSELKEKVHQLRFQGRSVIFTNGCFDIIHPGHVRYLKEAKKLGDFLIVALNSDSSVRSIKGPSRPIMGERERAEILCAFEFVDAVVIFEEENPLNLIKEIEPDVLVKGADWEEDKIIGADFVKAKGGRVERIPYLKGFSTTNIIERIKGCKKDEGSP